MIRKIPEKEVEVCDLCGRDGYLMTCNACNGRYCLTCDAIITGCVHKLDVCRACGEKPEVLAIAEKYVPQLVAVLKARDAELAELSNSALTEGGPVSVDCNSKPNPPFGAANGSQKL